MPHKERGRYIDLFEPGKELLKRDIPESIFLIDPFIPAGSVVILFGKPSIGKTPLMWQMAHAVQSGTPLFGHPTRQANVLMIELDMPLDLVQQRWADADPKFEPEFVTAFDTVTVDSLQFLNAYADERHREIKATFSALHAKYNFGLVCVDALREVIVGDLNPSGLPRRVYDAFKTVFPGAALLFVHHEKKTQQGFTPDPMQMASGNMEFINVAQIGLQFHKVGRETYLSHLKTQASAQFPPLNLKICDDGVHFTCPTETRYHKAVDIIMSSPGLGMRELDKLIGKSLDVSDRTARTIRRGLIQKGEIQVKAA